MSNYDAQTINSRNPLARFAHRTRVKKSVGYAKGLVQRGKILDYGCGSGVFINEMNKLQAGTAFGYEPFMAERTQGGLPIYRDFDDLKPHGPFATVALFETLEHLSDGELSEFLGRAGEVLQDDGQILISAPIEIGPALFLKEFNRFILKLKKPEHGLAEFMKAALTGKAAGRAPNIKTSHKGFDFRAASRTIESHGWKVSVLGFSPIPFVGWYGNSQVFLIASRQNP